MNAHGEEVVDALSAVFGFCFSYLWSERPEKRWKLEGKQERAEVNPQSIFE